MAARVDLNCDLGEGAAEEAGVMEHISSASVACGFHAGDPATMRRTVERARARGVAVGAHPGFRDPENFGRTKIDLPPEEVRDLALYQIGALDAFVRAAGLTLQHVKAHGALYNMAARSLTLAEALVSATAAYRPDLIFVGLPGSPMEEAARRAGVRFAAEVFADRTYQADGSLTPRQDPEAFVTDADEAAARVVSMIRDQAVRAVTGELVPLRADTVCLHGDNPQALAFAARIRQAIEEAGIAVAPLSVVVP